MNSQRHSLILLVAFALLVGGCQMSRDPISPYESATMIPQADSSITGGTAVLPTATAIEPPDLREVPIYVGNVEDGEQYMGSWQAQGLRLSSDGHLSGRIEMIDDHPPVTPAQAYRDLLFVHIVGTYVWLPSGDTTSHPAGDFIVIPAYESTARSATFVLEETLQMPATIFDGYNTQMPLRHIELQLIWIRVFGSVQEYLTYKPLEAVSNPTTAEEVRIVLDQITPEVSGQLGDYLGGSDVSMEYFDWIDENIASGLPTATPLPTRDPAAYPSPIQPTSVPYPYP